VAVDDPGALNDTGAVVLLRDEMCSTRKARRVDHSACRAGSVVSDVYRPKSMLAYIRQ
jgi:hypothetical protein